MTEKPTNRNLRVILGEARERATASGHDELLEFIDEAIRTVTPKGGMPDPGKGNTGVPVDVRCPGCDAPPPLMILTDALFAIRGRVDHLDAEIPPAMPVLAYRCECGTSFHLTARHLHLSG